MKLFEVHTENRREVYLWEGRTPAAYRDIIFPGSRGSGFGARIFGYTSAPGYDIRLNPHQLRSCRVSTVRQDFTTPEPGMLRTQFRAPPSGIRR